VGAPVFPGHSEEHKEDERVRKLSAASTCVPPSRPRLPPPPPGEGIYATTPAKVSGLLWRLRRAVGATRSIVREFYERIPPPTRRPSRHSRIGDGILIAIHVSDRKFYTPTEKWRSATPVRRTSTDPHMHAYYLLLDYIPCLPRPFRFSPVTFLSLSLSLSFSLSFCFAASTSLLHVARLSLVSCNTGMYDAAQTKASLAHDIRINLFSRHASST